MAKLPSLARLQRGVRQAAKRLYASFAQTVRRLLRQVARPRRRSRLQNSGFVLPTAVMLLLVMSLVVGAILLRTISRTEQAILGRREKVIYNAATPAIDRAKAKLEYMFTQDPSLPAGVPSQELLTQIMLDRNDGKDDYTFEGEKRLKINGEDANAWTYGVDSDGDGENDLTVAYSILWNIPDKDDANFIDNPSNDAVRARAGNLQVRQGPVSGTPTPGCELDEESGITLIENGWLRDPTSTAILRKNFQIDAVAIADTDDATISTIEVQQEREANRGNKWGAWFRNDLEVFPGPEFKWNGAMHTDGSLIVGDSTDRFQAYLVSGPGSCVYRASPSTSEITLDSNRSSGVGDDEDENSDYQGQIIAGSMKSNNTVGSVFFHLYDPEDPIHHLNGADQVTLIEDNDSVATGLPEDVALDPIRVFTEDESAYRGNVQRAGAWNDKDNNPFLRESRIYNEDARRPYVDDFYRADDRFGPKPVYGSDANLRLAAGEEDDGLGVKTGDPIAGNAKTNENLLITMSPGEDDDPTNLGFDGYWERRAWREGLRVIVGERLELGNDPFAGATETTENVTPTITSNQLADPDRLFPVGENHGALQRRTLRDNLAAVQTTAIYHYSSGTEGDVGKTPTTAILSTVHPGTAETLKRAAIFEKPKVPFDTSDYSIFGGTFGDDPDELMVDFFTGRGTNGWEIDVSELDITNTDVVDAITNLANFAGDIEGAFPAVQEAGEIHPNPAITEWGNFSNLRRTLNDDLGSLADFSNQHTAAITLGALAYNVAYLDGLDYSSIQTELQDVADRLVKLRDGIIDEDNGEIAFFPGNTIDGEFSYVDDAGNDVGIEISDTYLGTTITIEDSITDGENVPSLVIFNEDGEALTRLTPSPEAYIEALAYTGGTDAEIAEAQEIARLVYLKEQVKRDRRYGFLPSPTAQADFQHLIPDGIVFNENPKCNVEAPNDDCEVSEPLPLGISLNQNLAWDYNEANTVDFDNADEDNDFDTGTGEASADPLSLSFGCNVGNGDQGNNSFENFIDFGDPDWTDSEKEQRFIALANNLCGATPKFPALHYIFPPDTEATSLVQPESESGMDENEVAALEQRGIMDAGTDLNRDGGNDDDNIWYTSDSFVQSANSGVTYTPFDADKLNRIALKPLPVADWTLPYVNAGTSPPAECSNDADANNINTNCQKFNLVYDGDTSSYQRVAFKDTAFFFGRDVMNERSLNIDVELLSGNANGQLNDTINGDTWLPAGNDDEDVRLDGGMVYAFREDGVREDGIERPPGGVCTTAEDIGDGCNTDVIQNFDPQVNPDNGISPKPVNFLPDPDRRPNSFRIINGEDISRDTVGSLPYGLTFVSDNPAFVQGNFNCHKSPDGTCDDVIEEFEYTLSDKEDWGPTEFYGSQRNDVDDQNLDFAKPETDSWRYSEFLVDGLGILSDNFCDGSLEDAFIVLPNAGSGDPRNSLVPALKALGRSSGGDVDEVYGCVQDPAEGVTSYLNVNRPISNALVSDNALWMRENPADPTSPIRISASGNPLLQFNKGDKGDGREYDGNYFSVSNEGVRRDSLIRAYEEQRVNAIMISGIVPSRALQSYGGLHNFPRFTENWRRLNLFIAGSFLQLNFSTYTTGTYDQDSWEPGTEPVENEVLGYYRPPLRLWGYDVGLQLARPGPISSRLINVDSPRSEYYREIPADDPYIQNLRCASADEGGTVDPTANCT